MLKSVSIISVCCLKSIHRVGLKQKEKEKNKTVSSVFTFNTYDNTFKLLKSYQNFGWIFYISMTRLSVKLLVLILYISLYFIDLSLIFRFLKNRFVQYATIMEENFVASRWPINSVSLRLLAFTYLKYCCA